LVNYKLYNRKEAATIGNPPVMVTSFIDIMMTMDTIENIVKSDVIMPDCDVIRIVTKYAYFGLNLYICVLCVLLYLIQ